VRRQTGLLREIFRLGCTERRGLAEWSSTMPPVTEKNVDLIALLRERDPSTLDAVVQEHARPLYNISRALGFNDYEAEDLVQDAFKIFLQTLDRFEGRSQVRTWLIGILYRKARERRREQAREQKSDPIDAVFESRFDRNGLWQHPPEDLERVFASKEIGRMIAQCLDGVPPQQREVFLLREVEGLETKEICKILDLTVTHLGVLMHRARNRLRECLVAKGVSRKQ
jgi:RNA polymerase sigma-70 factor (ECF subfamily)